MSHFLGGFLAASVLWGGFVYAHATGIIDINLDSEDELEEAEAPVEEDSAEEAPGKRRKKKWRRKRRKRRYTGEAMTGDALGGPDQRNLDVDQQGGEEQLLGREIEEGFDSVFPKIKRCLLLAAEDHSLTGKLVFGMRIAGTGRVTRVNLRGPSAITKTEAGGCMRSAAKSIKFRSFNGPDMLVHYPLTLE